MAYDIGINENTTSGNSKYPDTVFNDRMLQLQNSLYDQITSMKGTFLVGLFSYNSSNKTGNLEREALPLGNIEITDYQAVQGAGSYNQSTVKDVAWKQGESLRDNESTLVFPYSAETGGLVSLGASVNGQWDESGDKNDGLSDASYDLNSTEDGNKKVKYLVTQDGEQTFLLESDEDNYLTVYKNGSFYGDYDNGSGNGTVCPPSHPNLSGSRPGDCYRYLANGDVEYVTGTYLDKKDARVTLDLDQGDELIFIMKTKKEEKEDTFKFGNFGSNKGYFYKGGGATPVAAEAQSIAAEFTQVFVPAGATITKADLVFRASVGSDQQYLTVRLDESLNPDSLVGTGADIEARQWDDQSVTVVGQSSNDTFRVDVRTLINNKLSQTDYCGGGTLVFMIPGITPSSDEPITTHAQENSDNNKKPKLDIEWSGVTGTACYSKAIDRKTNGISDDVYQKLDGTMVLESQTVEMGTSQVAGLRFTLINAAKYDLLGNPVVKVANDLSVSNAKLKLVAANNGSAGKVIIRAVDQGIAQLYSAGETQLDGRPVGASIEWNLPSWNKDQVYTSPDLSSIIDPLLARDDWEYGGSIGLLLSTLSSDSMQFYAWEADDNDLSVTPRRSGDSSDSKSDMKGIDFNWSRLGTFAPELNMLVNSSAPINLSTSVREAVVNKLFSNNFTPNSGTPIAGSFAEAAAYMLGANSYDGSPDYDSPLDTVGTCQSNTLVLLTDGVESYESKDGWWGGTPTSRFTSLVGGSCSDTNSWDCAEHLAEKLAAGTEWFDGTDDKTRLIKTYTIGYGKVATLTGNDGSKDDLNALAIKGTGKYYEADEIEKLAIAFKEIIGSVSDSGSSISVPGVAVSAFNRITLLDEVYYSLFKPSVRRNWAGNAKRYSLSGNTIVDVNGANAVNGSTTVFNDEAQSWWSDLADGSVVALGGAATHINPGGRKLYTYLGNGPSLGTQTGKMKDRGADLASHADARDLMTVDPLSFALEAYGIQGVKDFDTLSGAQIAALKQETLEWIQGGTEAAPRAEMGSPIHSSPVMLGYTKDGTELVSTIFVSTTEGYLHAIDTGEPTKDSAADKTNRGGKELFAFMPAETMRNAALLEENAVMANDDKHIYGLDSTWTYWRSGGDDTTISSDAGDPKTLASDDHVYIYSGMRRGGRMIYGLNVTDVHKGGAVTPKLLFAIGNPDAIETNHSASAPDTRSTTTVSGGVTTPTGVGKVALADLNFKNIGQTWSIPRVRKILWEGDPRMVLLFGGGNDPQHDQTAYPSISNPVGNQVYMVDATTGELLWMAKTDAAIAARLRPFDRTSDGYIDSFYAVDLAGRVLRFDLDGNDNFKQYNIAKLGTDGGDSENRKFYSEPSIALMSNPITRKIDIMIAVGSGLRPLPGDENIQDRFHMIYDRGAYAAVPDEPAPTIMSGDLVSSDIADGISENQSDAENIWNIDGWYYAFDKDKGEKALGTPLIFNNLVLFTTYVVSKEGTDDTCTPVLGSTRLYVLDVNSKSRIDIFDAGNSSGYMEGVSPGLASDVQVITVDGAPAVLNDKSVINTEDGKKCELVNCDGRDLDRSSWSSKVMAIDEGL
jgi:type IV pilus assembly protein PilY1